MLFVLNPTCLSCVPTCRLYPAWFLDPHTYQLNQAAYFMPCWAFATWGLERQMRYVRALDSSTHHRHVTILQRHRLYLGAAHHAMRTNPDADVASYLGACGGGGRAEAGEAWKALEGR